ncbi:hypothetical protein SETIT_4G153100v2 [Setaria italica]|uniref:Uncharacterized protein n=1 Tax=Setaria italica TaxID=4555 RepID=A0A368QV13_SETIT|nr:hypothetical protein SETIT_4G153100v2 [Setaria italica]RCV21629.1 hypothetical protein SETIT_4G153100v2 [Setaria italica]
MPCHADDVTPVLRRHCSGRPRVVLAAAHCQLLTRAFSAIQSTEIVSATSFPAFLQVEQGLLSLSVFPLVLSSPSVQERADLTGHRRPKYSSHKPPTLNPSHPRILHISGSLLIQASLNPNESRAVNVKSHGRGSQSPPSTSVFRPPSSLSNASNRIHVTAPCVHGPLGQDVVAAAAACTSAMAASMVSSKQREPVRTGERIDHLCCRCLRSLL